MGKKVTALVFVVLLMVVFSLTAFSESSNFEIMNENAIYGYSGKDKIIEIPEYIKIIYDFAFQYSNSIEKVIIPSHIEHLGRSIFWDCQNIKEVNYMSSLDINASMFARCVKLNKVTLNDGIERIGSSAFGLCESLKEIKLPSGLRRISDNAFSGSGLRKITIPSNVEYIEHGAFFLCKDLTEVTIFSENIKIEEGAFANSNPSLVVYTSNAAVMEQLRKEGIKCGLLAYVDGKPVVPTATPKITATPKPTATPKVTAKPTSTAIVEPPKPTKPKGISLEQKGTITLNKGQSVKLKYQYNPSYASSQLKWSSSKNKYATVDYDGTVYAVAEGTAKITVKTANGKKATVKVKVVDPDKVKGISLTDKGTITVNLEQIYHLNYSLTPSTAKTTLKWSSSKNKCVSVDENGNVFALSEGTATVTVKTANGKKASVKVKVVNPNKPEKIYISNATLGAKTINIGDTLKLEYSLKPSTAKTTVEWSSSKKKCVSVDNDGTIHAKEKGTATITVKTANGKKATQKIKVVDPYEPKGIKITRSAEGSADLFDYYNNTLTLKVGSTSKLGYVLEPATARTEVKWSSSKKSCVTVDSYGTIHAYKKGTATITAKTKNGKKATYKVKVIK